MTVEKINELKAIESRIKALKAEADAIKKEMQDEMGNEVYSAELTIHEGRFHQVKRMFEAVGCTVTYLKRLSMGSLDLGDLEKGNYRKLSEDEVKILQEK